jgi:hypothetical protein
MGSASSYCYARALERRGSIGIKAEYCENVLAEENRYSRGSFVEKIVKPGRHSMHVRTYQSI